MTATIRVLTREVTEDGNPIIRYVTEYRASSTSSCSYDAAQVALFASSPSNCKVNHEAAVAKGLLKGLSHIDASDMCTTDVVFTTHSQPMVYNLTAITDDNVDFPTCLAPNHRLSEIYRVIFTVINSLKSFRVEYLHNKRRYKTMKDYLTDCKDIKEDYMYTYSDEMSLSFPKLKKMLDDDSSDHTFEASSSSDSSSSSGDDSSSSDRDEDDSDGSSSDDNSDSERTESSSDSDEDTSLSDVIENIYDNTSFVGKLHKDSYFEVPTRKGKKSVVLVKSPYPVPVPVPHPVFVPSWSSTEGGEEKKNKTYYSQKISDDNAALRRKKQELEKENTKLFRKNLVLATKIKFFRRMVQRNGHKHHYGPFIYDDDEDTDIEKKSILSL